jgi:hypothetical protein
VRVLAVATIPIQCATIIVLGGFGSEIGSNLNRTEPDAAFRFEVQRFAEPELKVRFDARDASVAFDRT